MKSAILLFFAVLLLGSCVDNDCPECLTPQPQDSTRLPCLDTPSDQNIEAIESVEMVVPWLECMCTSPTTVPFISNSCEHVYCKGDIKTIFMVRNGLSDRPDLIRVACSYYRAEVSNRPLFTVVEEFKPSNGPYTVHSFDARIPHYYSYELEPGTILGVECTLKSRTKPAIQAFGELPGLFQNPKPRN